MDSTLVAVVLVIGASAIGIAIGSAMHWWQEEGSNPPRSPWKEPPTNEPAAPVEGPLRRLHAYLADSRRYRIYVPDADRPRRWVEVRGDDTALETVAGHPVAIDDVRRFAVTYPSGELLDIHPAGAPLPSGAKGIGANGVPIPTAPTDADLAAGAEALEVSFGECDARPDEPGYYSLSVTNRTGAPLRVKAFAAYTRRNGAWVLWTVTEGVYSPLQFKEWFGVTGDGSIAPGATVTDPNSYGTGDHIWAFWVEDAGGRQWIGSGKRAP